MKFETVTLDKSNAILFAVANYSNQQTLGLNEFRQDYKLFKKINKVITKEQYRLALNLIITVNNIFHARAARKLLLYFTELENINAVNTMQYFLGNISFEEEESRHIEIDLKLLAILQSL